MSQVHIASSNHTSSQSGQKLLTSALYGQLAVADYNTFCLSHMA